MSKKMALSKPQGLGGKAGYVTPITANHAASNKMGYSA